METGFGFLILFGLSCMLFPGEGGIISPAKGTEFTFLPGTTGNITWIFDDAISSLDLRRWVFTRRGGSTPERLATISDDDDHKIRKSSLSGVEIVKPGTLLLKNVNESHNGVYKFEISASGPTVASDVVVFIAKKPNVTFSCSPSPITVDEGDNFTCLCKGEGGNPPANVTWYKDKVQIGETGKENQTLTVVGVNETDSGTYKCEARSHTNDSFADEKSINLTVRQLTEPNITSFTITPDSVAKEGQKVTITCISKGVPYPNNDIFRNGSEVNTEKTTSTEVSSEKTSTTYTIDSVTPGDAGIYTCIAKNKVGNDSATVNLTVQGQVTPTIPTPSTSYAATSSNGTEPTPTTPPTSASTSGSTSASTSSSPDLPTGAIIGIIIGVLVLIIIVGVVVYCCKSKEKERSNSCANIDPVPGNSHELGETGPGDGAYDTVWPVETSGSKSKPPVENALPPVYAAVDKNNREGNTLYASLDNEALQSSRASKKEPDRPPETDYASIDFAKTGNAPKAV